MGVGESSSAVRHKRFVCVWISLCLWIARHSHCQEMAMAAELFVAEDLVDTNKSKNGVISLSECPSISRRALTGALTSI